MEGRRLALGTAQFGLPYGIANRAGQVRADEVRAILTHARRAGIDLVDTAIAYGTSEATLGAAGLAGWAVVSKLPPVPEGCADIERWVRTSVEGTLQRLGIPQLYGLLLHRPAQLLSRLGPLLHRALVGVREEGLTRRIGISVYAPAEALAVHERFPCDLLQAPLNVFDRRMLDEGVLARLTAAGVEVHARSVFLQGLLLLRADERPAAFDRWRGLWDRWDRWLRDAGLAPLEACLRFAAAQPGFSRIVVGVDTLAQLQGVLQALEGAAPALPPGLECRDERLIDPSRWSEA